MKRTWRLLWIPLLLLALGIGLTFLGARLLSRDPAASLAFSIAVGVALALGAAVYESRMDLDEIRHTIAHYRQEMKGMASHAGVVPEDRRAMVEQCSHSRGYYIEKSQIAKVWGMLCADIKHYYWATNYIDISEIYGSWADKALDGQIKFLKSLHGKNHNQLRKVWIVDDPKELKSTEARATYDKQTAGDIKIEACLRPQVDSFLPWQDRIGQDYYDFAVVDDEVLMIWHINPATRKLMCGELSFEPARIKLFREAFEELFGLAERQKLLP